MCLSQSWRICEACHWRPLHHQMPCIQARLMLRGPAARNPFPTLWVPSTKMSCCMPRCGNGDSLTSTRSCLTKLHRCCGWSEKDGCNSPIEIGKKFTFYCGKNTIFPKHDQIWTSKFRTFRVTTIVASLWQNTFRSAGMFMLHYRRENQ